MEADEPDLHGKSSIVYDYLLSAVLYSCNQEKFSGRRNKMVGSVFKVPFHQILC